MARILNTRVIYGVRQGFFNGKEPEFSPDLQTPFTPSDYEENRILLLVDPKTQPQVTARIYRIPVAKPKKKQKSFDLIAINDINSEKDIKLKEIFIFDLDSSLLKISSYPNIETEIRTFKIDNVLSFFKMVLVNNYPIFSIEDACAEDDYEGWKNITKVLGKKIQLDHV